MIDIIYCAGGNKRYADLAVEHGFLYGSRLPETVYYPLYFADQEYKDPDFEGYARALSQYHPTVATVLDWEREDQFNEVLSWGEMAAQYVETVIIIPKVHGGVNRIPKIIGGKPIRLGYSVPTGYGGTDLFASEFVGREVHLLGGTPHRQMKLLPYFNVASIDGNYMLKMANRGCFWQPGTAYYASSRYWPTLKDADGDRWGDGSNSADACYEAFRRSCISIMQAWKGEQVTQWGPLDKRWKRTSSASKELPVNTQLSLDL